MPFAINVIKRLAAADWEVDVFLWEQPLVDYREIFSNTVRVRYQVAPKTDVVSYTANPSSPTNRRIYDLRELSVCIWFGANR